MQVLLESQSSDLLKEMVESQLNPLINGKICLQDAEQPCSLTEIEQRQVIDLLLAPMSPNRVARHFSQVFRKQLSAWSIKQLLLSFRTKIEYLNERFDIIAGRKAIILQIDETFKGHKVSILVVIDAITGYVFHLQWLTGGRQKLSPSSYIPLANY
jgi:hypothetical protein